MENLDHTAVLQIFKPTKVNFSPIIVDSPHSGTVLPQNFIYSCQKDELHSITDHYVDELFDRAPEYGAVLIKALFSRSYIDVNRRNDDIDWSLLDQPWPENKGEINPSERSHAGIGLIPRLIKPGTPIYNRALSPDEILDRIKQYYTPYHNALRDEIDQAYYNHGQSYHINCHSMPNSSAYPKYKISLQKKASDIVLGNRNGTTCCPVFTHFLRDFWEDKGYRVTINDPFKGVELITAYSQPTLNKHSIQLEINRSLYMNEESKIKKPHFDTLKAECSEMIERCVEYANMQDRYIAAD